MKLKIAVLAGDGIGPEVTNEAIRVLKAVGTQFDHTFLFEPAKVGAIAIDATGNPLRKPAEVPNPALNLTEFKMLLLVISGTTSDSKNAALTDG